MSDAPRPRPKPPNWIEPPSLQRLVIDHGGYDRITPEAWAKFDAEMAAWKADVRAGVLHRRD
jgi:hypothetical protein